MGKKLENRFRIRDWIRISHVVEPEMHLQLDESNVDYYNKIKKKEGISGPRKVGVFEVKKYYEEKIREHKEESSFAKMMVFVYKNKLDMLIIRENEK